MLHALGVEGLDARLWAGNTGRVEVQLTGMQQLPPAGGVPCGCDLLIWGSVAEFTGVKDLWVPLTSWQAGPGSSDEHEHGDML